MTRIVLRKFGKWTVEEHVTIHDKSLVVSNGWITDYPSDRGDGRIAYDRPEGIPEGVKAYVASLIGRRKRSNPEHTACICESWGGRRLMPDKPCPVHAADDEAQRIDAAMLAAEEREHV